jgi:hypothetical protein
VACFVERLPGKGFTEWKSQRQNAGGKTKAGHFEPSKFEDQYEDALKELLKEKQEGKPIERPERPKPTNVVNLMDSLRQSVEASGASTASKPKADAPARRTAHEKTEQPKRKKARRTG